MILLLVVRQLRRGLLRLQCLLDPNVGIGVAGR